MIRSLKLAVLGSPIAHSRSPQLQTSFADDCGMTDFSYERIETTRETLLPTIRRLRDEDYDGFNCTMPLKTDMALLADVLSEEARILCSANTAAIKDGNFHCTTTDGGGILLTIRRGYRASDETPESVAAGKRVMLLGAGGAARSAALSLARAGARLTIHNRHLDAAYALRTMLDTDCECRPFDEASLMESARDTDIVINCTSLGMSGKPAFESLSFLDVLPRDAMVIDAVYNPLETELLKSAASRGLAVMSGLWMLVYQGALAFEQWSGVLPDEDACKKAFDLIK